MSEHPLLFLLVILLLAICVRLPADYLDRRRIRKYVEKGGGKVVDIRWNPFGPGWFGSRERLYDVKYTTRRGAMHGATCKTTMFSGIYWAGDTTGESEEPDTPPEPISCLACGTRIPASQIRCPNCRWSYKQN